MTLIRRAFVLALAAAALMFPVSAALADQIDGHWCFTDGRVLSIDGAKIVTPAATGSKATTPATPFPTRCRTARRAAERSPP